MHPTHPQQRVIKRVAEQVRCGDVLAYPTDSSYALGCLASERKALERIRAYRRLNDNHPLTMVCKDLAQIGKYAVVDNQTFRILKAYLPGPYTFVLPASKAVPRPAQGMKRRNIGVRMPDHAIVLALLNELDEPILSTTYWTPTEDGPFAVSHPDEIPPDAGKCVNLIVDGGEVPNEPTTVVDLTGPVPEILRAGAGHFD